MQFRDIIALVLVLVDVVAGRVIIVITTDRPIALVLDLFVFWRLYLFPPAVLGIKHCDQSYLSISVSLKLPRIYPITDPRLSGLSHAEQVKRLIAGGATLIQLRDKHATPREFYHQAAAALKIARRHGVSLIVNDRVDIALALGADGVHLGQTDMPAEAARDLLGQTAIVGISTHNLAQAQFATRLPVDYIAFGPIFGTSTRANPDPTVGLSTLNEVRSIVISLPLVAIGGIDFANARATLEAGADAVAIISALVAEPTQIQEKMRRMLLATNS